MRENKTKPSEANVAQYLAGIENPARREDCKALANLMTRASGQRPRMWGDAIVGFGVRSYRYESGREGEICQVGFSSRKGDISIYGVSSGKGADALMAKLGKHRKGKSCLYISKLSDVEQEVLEQLVANAARA
jgi:Domain of unknown function (DU1801)